MKKKKLFTVLIVLAGILSTAYAQTPTEGEEVDLGLSVNWRAYDLGSTTPSTPGTLYAYGVPAPSNYQPYNYIYTYPLYSWDLNAISLPEGGISGNPNYDAAAAESDGYWRMATKAEWQELLDGCNAQVTTIDGCRGYLFTSKINGNSIFFSGIDSFCKYYTGDNSGSLAYIMYADTWFGEPQVKVQDGDLRNGPWQGFPLRPVCSKEHVQLEAIALTADRTEIFVNTYAHLTAAATPEDAIIRGSYSSSNESVATVTDNGLVKGVGDGTAVITIIDGDVSASVTITVTAVETDLSQPLVDLGLSVDWKTMNEGAESYTEYGTVYPFATATATTYENAFKYPYYNSNQLKYNFPLENFAGNPNYDAVARAAGEGSAMRLPTKIEMEELIANCTSELVTVEGSNFVRFTSDINGKYILFPLDGTYANYYSGSTNADRNSAITLYLTISMGSLSVKIDESGSPYKTGALRGVVEHSTVPDLSGIALDKADVQIYTENTVKITAVATPVGALLDGLEWSSSDESVAKVDDRGVVTGVSEGAVVITAAVGEISASSNIIVKDPGICLDEKVDMGTDVLWSPCNLGTSLPSGQGGLYCWGALEPRPDNTADENQWADPDIDNIGETDYDVVYKEVGNGWRMPSRSDFARLVQNSTFEWIVNGGRKGALITSKTTENRLFLPLADGYDYIFYFGTEIFRNNSSDGLPFVEGLYIIDNRYDTTGQYPWKPFPVRPVFDPSFVPTLEEIHIKSENENFELLEGEVLRLIAHPHPEKAVFNNLTWSSSNPSVAAVDAEGNVSGIHYGKATISASDGEINSSVVVSVNELTGLQNCAGERVVEGIYTIDGSRILGNNTKLLAPGVYIIKYNDGSAEKIICK